MKRLNVKRYINGFKDGKQIYFWNCWVVICNVSLLILSCFEPNGSPWLNQDVIIIFWTLLPESMGTLLGLCECLCLLWGFLEAAYISPHLCAICGIQLSRPAPKDDLTVRSQTYRILLAYLDPANRQVGNCRFLVPNMV